MVVVGADVFMLQEGEQFGFVSFESLNDPVDILVDTVGNQKDLLKAIMQSCFPAIVLFRAELILSLGDGVIGFLALFLISPPCQYWT